jgi:hypothetical protein
MKLPAMFQCNLCQRNAEGRNAIGLGGPASRVEVRAPEECDVHICGQCVNIVINQQDKILRHLAGEKAK